MYQPMKITAPETGLVQEREAFLLPNDAYPTLENAYVWRERIKRKQGTKLLGRLRRTFDNESLGNTGGSPWSFNIYTLLGITKETNAEIELGSVRIYLTPATASGAITGANNSTNCEVFTAVPHGLTTGDRISITGVVGMPEINDSDYVVSVVSPTSFTINRNSLNWGVYESGGTWTETTAAVIFTDNADGTLSGDVGGNSGTIDYFTGAVTLTHTVGAGSPAEIDFKYFPSLPCMGLRGYEANNINLEKTVAFDTKYAYEYIQGGSDADSGFKEWIPGTTWSGIDSNFFYSTNYWVSSSNSRLFWVTNFSGVSGDPIRYSDGTSWFDFGAGSTPIVGRIDSSGTFLNQALALAPFRGRLVAFNTFEGSSLAGSEQFRQRIRWASIGNPLIVDTLDGGSQNGSWRSDVRGRGGFLDIPTAQSIIAIGFVRDNLIIFCERSTWNLRYTGNATIPFAVEKVNTELGAESTFSAVQFDTSLVAIGDKGIVECDAYKSNRIDIKIPDLVYQFSNATNALKRVHGIRDFVKRLVYWTFPLATNDSTYPDRRLVYNYENDSWAIFTDSLTCLGNYQPLQRRKWKDATVQWKTQNIRWINRQTGTPLIIGGNQQGFVSLLDSQVTNGISLGITAITSGTPTTITSPNHNLQSGQIIKISNIPTGTGYASDLNDNLYSVVRVDANDLEIMEYDSDTDSFITPKTTNAQTYVGGGRLTVVDNFRIVSKKFNYLDQGENVQIGYLDILTNNSENGAFSLNVYNDYNDSEPTNRFPQNSSSDTVFNITIPTNAVDSVANSKSWQRVYCATRASFLTLEYTFSNAQMIGEEQGYDVQVDAQILWMRPAGKDLTRTL